MNDLFNRVLATTKAIYEPMIIETSEYRDLIRTEITAFGLAESLASNFNKRYNVKTGVLVVAGSQIVCGNFTSFRSTKYIGEYHFHPETTILDMYSSEIESVVFYIAKLNIKNESQPSRPCKRCMTELKQAPELGCIVYRDEKLRIVKEVIE